MLQTPILNQTTHANTTCTLYSVMYTVHQYNLANISSFQKYLTLKLEGKNYTMTLTLCNKTPHKPEQGSLISMPSQNRQMTIMCIDK